MPGIVYVMPDFGGALLSYTQAKKDIVLWQDRTQLLLTGIEKMELNGAGVNPAEGALRLTPTGYILNLYGPLLDKIGTELRGAYLVEQLGYDWRKSVLNQANEVADVIQHDATAEAPARIVAHGLAGLVARQAYNILKAGGKEGLLKKIVTLGTPHYGCYGPADVWGLRDNVKNDLCQMYKIWMVNFGNAAWLQSPVTVGTKKRVLQSMNTWPSLYEMGPFVGPLSVINDSQADRFWDVSLHPSYLELDAGWMGVVPRQTQPQFTLPERQVPAAVLKCVAGTGVKTIIRLKDPSKMDTDEAYQFGLDGDGMVSDWSAIAGSANYLLVKAEHSQLPSSPIVLKNIVPWLFETVPPAPVPLPELIDQVRPQPAAPSVAINPAPVVQGLQRGLGLACASGGCKC